MNVPNLKVTMFMTDVYGVGWQESHYRVDANNPATPLSTWVPQAIEICKARAACLHASFYTLTDCRLSYDNVFRDSYLLKPTDLPVATGSGATTKYDGGVAASGTQYQTVQSAIPMLLTLQQFKKRAINYMSGFLSSVAQYIRFKTTVPAGYAPFAAYGQYLCALDAADNPRTQPSLWGTKITLPQNPLGTAIPPITASAISYIPRVGGRGFILHINTAAPLTDDYVTGNTVYLAGFKIITTQQRIRINGSYEIVNRGHDAAPVNQDFIEIAKPSMLVAPASTALGNITGSGTFVLPYQFYTFRQATHHKRGKPSFEPRGRK